MAFTFVQDWLILFRFALFTLQKDAILRNKKIKM